MRLVLPRNPNVFAHSPLDRAAHRRMDGSWLEAARADSKSLFMPLWKLNPFIIRGRDGRNEAGWVTAELARPLMQASRLTVFLGVHRDSAHFAIDISGEADPERSGPLAGLGSFADLRTVAGDMDPGDAAILAQAKALIDWHQRHGFCANCGKPTMAAEAGYKRTCEACSTEHFPRTDPVVIMLPVHGDTCLMGRQPKWPPGFYSALAGFIEPGETIEEAVARECKEEAGIDIGDVAFHSTQPWPYPSSLMIGCYARAKTTEIHLDGNELSDAKWFTREQVRAAMARGTNELRLPPPLAIAHQLVRTWLEDA